MPNLCMVVEYDGHGFHGWQIQPGQRTIQGELHRVLEMVLRTKIKVVHSAGRTDAGVHALRQVVNFFVEELPPDLQQLGYAVSSLLRGELAVLDVRVMPEHFHSRRSAKAKLYTYRLLNRGPLAVLDRGRAWHLRSELDLQRMQAEAVQFVGVHDFESFRGSGCTAPSAVKEIHKSEFVISPPFITYRVVGSGFLKQMVRIMVGTLVDFGRGRERCASISEILAAKDRRQAGVTAPPWGLYLDRVEYGEEFLKEIENGFSIDKNEALKNAASNTQPGAGDKCKC